MKGSEFRGAYSGKKNSGIEEGKLGLSGEMEETKVRDFETKEKRWVWCLRFNKRRK